MRKYTFGTAGLSFEQRMMRLALDRFAWASLAARTALATEAHIIFKLAAADAQADAIGWASR